MVTPHDIDGVVYTGIKGHEWAPHCWHGFEFTIHARSTSGAVTTSSPRGRYRSSAWRLEAIVSALR